LDAARKSGVGGMGPAKVEGGAKLSVDFRNMPAGTRTWLSHFGVFDEAEINHGKTMVRAPQE
jgi:hypothetical protein